MSDGQDNVCRDCGKALNAGLFGAGTRVMGASFCEDCVVARTMYCHTCRTPIRKEDFERGKAITLLGRRFCEKCLESAVRQGREQAVADPAKAVRSSSAPSAPLVKADDGTDPESIAIRRLYGRYVPPADAELVVKGSGLAALLGNRVRLWLDVSEGGFRAIVAGGYKLEDRLDGSVVYAPAKRSFPFHGTVKHARPSQLHRGCVLVGARFDQPSKELQAFIKSKMSGRPVMIPAPGGPS